MPVNVEDREKTEELAPVLRENWQINWLLHSVGKIPIIFLHKNLEPDEKIVTLVKLYNTQLEFTLAEICILENV